ncbi:ParB/RepB/Spo0J family partition protein [Planktothrix sp. FACHB-1355]|uniref:ParB/RepB/Spo0J family partition protein n=1 Tax=Aerosakkonema funiforme FACHB-1375 TaxID=2949571 RepID=A0A926ZGE2_9CYAN|nr:MULTISPECIES: ParB/RepB/Spo0J family partition protein [Oscillatoriales]MBD2181865.1 ParB/RepB/Spo0J family partition protein [Aerosakkonema funiforme FACHB-1375]MBD3557285.1 ParB/RepB/Spo0J family partition protein [Planktothrix sp. FACHB-1355]
MAANRRSLKQFVFGEEEASTLMENPQSLPITAIALPASQPRRYFDSQKLEELTQSVRSHGILEPLLVRPLPEQLNQYELVAGERRYRAAKAAGLTEVPVTIRQLTDIEALQLSLIENLQREDLSPVEETEGILQLLSFKLEMEVPEVTNRLYRMRNENSGLVSQNVLTNSEGQAIQSLFDSLGLVSWESFITTRLPLLKLPEEIKEALRKGDIAYTKAQVIARVKDALARRSLLDEAVELDLSLVQIKEKIAALNRPQVTNSEKNPTLKSRVDTTYRLLKKSKVWDDPQKEKDLEKLLAQIEALVSDSSGEG